MIKKIVKVIVPAILIASVCFALSACAKKKTLESIEISSMPAKTVYDAGENFNKEGLVVKAVYSDKSKKEVTDYDVDKTQLKYGDDKITVTYKDKKAYLDVTVKDYSTFAITADIPEDIKTNTDYSINVTLKADEERDYGYKKALIYIDVQKPAGGTLSLKARDTLGAEYDVARLGVWGPPTGFPMGGDYNVTTAFTARFDTAGNYKIRISVYSLDDADKKDKLITEKTFSIDVTQDNE